MIRYYARRAGEYDRIYEIPEWQGDLERLRERVRAACAGRRVFEVACGTGYWTRIAGEVARAVCATDLNPETLEIARERCADLPHVEFRVADAYEAGGDGASDAGLAGLWLSHVDVTRLPAFLAAFHAHLAPGARVLMFDERLTPDRRPAASRFDDAGNRYERRRLASGERFEIIKNFHPAERMRAMFGEWGRDVTYQELDRFWVLEYRAR